jgi:hypothetical protein
MDDLLKKLYYKGQERIAVIEAPAPFNKRLTSKLKGVQIDASIDPRYLYDFILLFVKTNEDVKKISHQAIHNISPDGKLWIAYPKGTSLKFTSEIDRDHGWEPFEQTGFRRVSQIAVDDDWYALRFRNKKYVKSLPKEE